MLVKSYKKEFIRGDLSSGLLVAALLIPQGIAYALIAGLPPVVGLYTATIPVLIYLFLGSSPHLSIGPVAMIAILIFHGVTPYSDPGTAEFLGYVIILTLLVGIIQIILTSLKFGLVATYVPHSVISGFTSGCAIIISVNQLSNIIKIPIQDQGNIVYSFWIMATKINEVHILSLVMAIVAILLLITLNKLFPNFPNPLILLIISISVVYLLNLNTFGVAVIGEIPRGMPPFSFPKINMDIVSSMLPHAIVIAFIGFIETFAIGNVIAKKEGYTIKPNKELKALGIANFVGAFFSAMPVAGGFSRTAVNYNAGAKSKISSAISVIIIFITLVFFTNLFFYIPKVILSTIILLSVVKLIDVKEAVFMLRRNSVHGSILIVTFSTTIVAGPKFGLVIGILLSIMVRIRKVKIYSSI